MTGGHDSSGHDGVGGPTGNPEPGRADGRSPDVERSATEKNEADWAGRPENDGKTAKVGARDVERPTDTPSEAEAAPAGGELHERLARKDQTPVEDGGSSSLS